MSRERGINGVFEQQISGDGILDGIDLPLMTTGTG